MKTPLVLFASAAMFLAACNSSNQKEAAPATDSAATEAAPAEAVSPEALVTISGGDDMKFDLTEIKVKEGQTVKLTLKHVGKTPVTAMGHNFVLLVAGANLENFATEAIKAKDTDYIPQSMVNDVIAHTKTIGGGESTEIEFPAPAKGTYDFLCSFPGHSAMMKGKFIVE